MGDQIGSAVEGRLYYAPLAEFRRIRSLPVDPIAKAEIFAALCRLNALYMIGRAGSGHIGSSFSSLDIVSWILLNEVDSPDGSDGHLYFSSKGHDAPGYYAALIGLGRLEFDLIHRLRRLPGLPGHPDISTPNIVTNTGSLGMGISKGKGIVVANRLKGLQNSVFVLTGDGELQEGQIWESLASAANCKMYELVVIVDHNKLQSDTLVAKVSDLGDLEAKFRSFGWFVLRCDGNDIGAFCAAIEHTKTVQDQPKVIIADTIKGKGVSFMEHTAIDNEVENYQFHSGAPDAASYQKATQELIDDVNIRLRAVAETPLVLETIEQTSTPVAANQQRLISAYGDALVEVARKHDDVVALDADLVLDTGLIPFSEKFPDRFIECGIAEQDMVSQAGGLALRGLLPIVHSFASFLSTRPNEQVYNNSTEGTKIVYVGSLAGVLPAGPGHSHQSVRDISALGAMPNMVLIQPSCEDEVRLALEYCVERAVGASYLRLVSIPREIRFELPEGYELREGQGVTLADGADAALIAYGPVMLSEAMRARELLAEQNGLSLKVINLPWLNRIDGEWLEETLADLDRLFTVDDHYLVGGQGQLIAAKVSTRQSLRVTVHSFGLTEVPGSGTNDEVLRAHGLDAESLARSISAILQS